MTKIEPAMSHDLTLYTDEDIERARNRGKVVGWIQGGLGVLLVGLVLKALGWIPTLLVTGLVGYVIYRLLVGGKKDPEV